MGRQPFRCVVAMAATVFLLIATPAFAKNLEPEPVPDAFCQAHGWAEADKYDIDSKKEQAETLSGEVCAMNKCKMFDYIECEN